jgi:hypothetical protein
MAGLTTSWLALRLFEDRGTVRLLMASCPPVRVRVACVLVLPGQKNSVPRHDREGADRRERGHVWPEAEQAIEQAEIAPF